MNRGTLSVLAALCLSALIAGGCAKKDVVKSEEPLVKEVAPKVELPKPEAPKPIETDTSKQTPEVVAAQQTETQATTPSAAEASLETVYFDFDKSDLRQDTRDALNRNAEILLKSQPKTKIRIEGHCDERGSAEYNLALGERRATSALQYLITLGVKADRLSTVSYGKEKPAVQGHDESAWSKNRRAEFVIVK